MRASAQVKRLPRAVPLAAGALVVALAAAACGTGGPVRSGDTARGKTLFQQRCGSCHTLADAGSSGTIGPDLDAAFEGPRKQGFRDVESTIRQIVYDQILYPPQGRSKPDGTRVTSTGAPVMPANLVTGDDARAVAAYVASVAGKPVAGGGGGAITATDGKEIFTAAGCGSCHTLADAGSTGTIGPNLDASKPSRSLVIDRVTNGRGAMPSFKGKLTAKQIDAVAGYVSSVAGK